MKSFPLLCLLLASISFVAATEHRFTKDNPLDIHVVPHTHDDTGWLKTVDEYFLGANNSIQHAGVQYILDSVVQALIKNPKRKFIYVEIAYFARWWDEQDEETKSTVRTLVKEERLVFINGGWCMNDEAATYYGQIVDQMTVGHQFLLENFGVAPSIGWHIDPFGHSSAMSQMLAMMGMDAFYFGRTPQQDHDMMVNKSRLEKVWRPSPNLGISTQIFSGNTYGNNYNPLPGFCFDSNHCDDAIPIQDDPNIFNFNIESRADLFVKESLNEARSFRTANIMLTMGSDFQYENAHEWYKNLDKLMDYIERDPKGKYSNVRVFYSTPVIYTEAVHKANLTWAVKTDDYFPYNDDPHAYWTGYFTSRPALKRYVRMCGGQLQVCKQLQVWSLLSTKTMPKGDVALFKRVNALTQHHDAVTGTEKQHVAFDYAERLAMGQVQCDAAVSDALNLISTDGRRDGEVEFQSCHRANVSLCEPTSKPGTVVSVVYNQLATERTQWVRVPVATSNAKVSLCSDSSSCTEVPSSVLAHHDPNPTGVAPAGLPFTLSFQATVAPLGFQTYFIEVGAGSPSGSNTTDTAVVLDNQHLRVEFDDSTGRIRSVEDKARGVVVQLDQQLLWYNASIGNATSGQASGAYIFRPNSSEAFNIEAHGNAQNRVDKNEMVQEVFQTFGSWAKQTVRLFHDSRTVELEYTIGPIPIADHWGKEIISRFSTNLANVDEQKRTVAFTDANGREMRKRVNDFRESFDLNLTGFEHVAGNFYPVNTAIYIEDSASRVALVTDRSHGGGSLNKGQFEVMLHRRLLKDDGRGVGEALNETGLSGKGLVVRGTQKLIIGDHDTAAQQQRFEQQNQAYPFQLRFAPIDDISAYRAQHRQNGSLSARALPENLHLLTLERLDDGDVLIRLAHLFERDEHPTLGKPVTVSLDSIVHGLEIGDVIEMTLTANRAWDDYKAPVWSTHDTSGNYAFKGAATGIGANLEVTLNAMQIRTFRITPKA